LSFLLDTNICSASIRNPTRLIARFQQHAGRLFLSAIVLAELYDWAYGRNPPDPRLKVLEDFLNDLVVLPFDPACAEQCGKLRSTLRPRGITIPPLDLLIASTALVHGFTLVTHNTRDFARIPGLAVVDWLAP
jgi:tRNA(fMet)-specific endonuclease VapC